jgi:hypothetical protein
MLTGYLSYQGGFAESRAALEAEHHQCDVGRLLDETGHGAGGDALILLGVAASEQYQCEEEDAHQALSSR